MTDAEFEAAIEKIRRGDRDGLREIYDAYGTKMYRLFLAKVKQPADAEDLTSEFFLKLWSCADSYRAGNGHKCWLNTIARNMAVDTLRKRRWEVSLEEVQETHEVERMDETGVEDTVLGSMQTVQILSKLAADEREIVQLHIAAELTFREIAVILKRPLGTVAWKYRNAIQKLQKLAEEGQLV